MAENTIELKSVNEILGMKFFIPCYQRGYRWTQQQVLDLLNDINDFNPQPIPPQNIEKTWYCLQPLVIRKMDSNDTRLTNENEKNDWYEVIDGQQRLTTVFLIIHYFNEMWAGKKKYKIPIIKYETRSDCFDFMTSLEICPEKNCVNHSDADKHIDFLHMRNAYNVINQWAEKQESEMSNFDDTLRTKFIQDTKFIWYESREEDPIKVFTRLNIGKISLTNSELIKALFLNCSNFDAENNNHIKLKQQEIASEWDNIEYTLQNNEFWLFLHSKGYTKPTRIDFIFDLICEEDKLNINLGNRKDVIIGTDDYRTFRYFYEYFKTRNHDIKKCWDEVKKHFQIFMEWFNDLTLYHYIGFLIEQGYQIPKLVEVWNGQDDKKTFIKYLKNEIKSCIFKKLKVNKIEDAFKLPFVDKTKCKPLLLFHNIQTVINQNNKKQSNEKYQFGVFYKFPFHLYKLENWDVEHINSYTTNSEEDSGTQREWLINVYLSTDDDTQQKIKDYLEQDNPDATDINDLYDKIKKEIGGGDVWTDEEKNRIWNYALLDSSTNRSYGNMIFSGKRRIIIGKDKGKLIGIPQLKDKKLTFPEEQEANSSFVPPCTRQIFMKYYSATTGNANYWSKELDAEKYQSDIEECLKKLED